jgi:hypothetical protein
VWQYIGADGEDMENTTHLDESAAFLSILKSRFRKLNLPINVALASPPIET